jgi:hypothetical protein
LPVVSRHATRAAARPALGGLQQRVAGIATSPLPLLAWAVLVLASTALLVCAMVPVGPDWFGVTGSVVVGTTYSWALAARTGGRPVIFGTLALVIGLLAVWADGDLLSTGAAVLTSVVAAVLGVMATVPAKTFLGAVRECLVGMVLAGVGAMAAVGFEPTIDVTRFEYLGLGLALVGAEVLVFRLGAGLHGLGRRGVLVVAIGAALLLATLLYAELLRRYGSTGLVDWLLERVDWSRDHLGAFPRPIVAVLGVPALAYGSHMRARRRQGWWVCAFGVAATSPVATSLGNPVVDLSEVVLSEVYGLAVGLVLAFVVIRLDLALTGNRGRRSRTAEQEAAVRPEPARTSALL